MTTSPGSVNNGPKSRRASASTASQNGSSEIVREVGEDTEVILDNGIMSGADIVGALRTRSAVHASRTGPLLMRFGRRKRCVDRVTRIPNNELASHDAAT